MALDLCQTRSSGRVMVTVSDDVVGFDTEACEWLAGHFRLRGMRERARRIDAEFTIQPRPGGGSRVVVGV
jgi:signal transduction histidine kinase